MCHRPGVDETKGLRCGGDNELEWRLPKVCACTILARDLAPSRMLIVCCLLFDFCSDALAAQVGGIGIAPGGNINYLTGHAIFEATHGTAPKYANLDKVPEISFNLSIYHSSVCAGESQFSDFVSRYDASPSWLG